MSDPIILKRKIIITFIILLLLILSSGALGWIFTQRIERSNKVIDVVHLFKESELQLRREEKNLLIRGYSTQRYLRWQKAKEDFHQRFGELIGMKALSDSDIARIKFNYTEMSDTYNKFFDDIKTNALSQNEVIKYDDKFKKIGRETLEIINSILAREQRIASRSDSQADILIGVFSTIFVAAAFFLIINVIKHL